MHYTQSIEDSEINDIQKIDRFYKAYRIISQGRWWKGAMIQVHWMRQECFLSYQLCDFWYLSILKCQFPFYPLMEKAMAPHSSTLAWKIPWTEEPRRLQSMGSIRVGHNWATSLSLFTFMHWRRKWQPTPAFLPAESQGRGSLVGCRPWGRTESDTIEVT